MSVVMETVGLCECGCGEPTLIATHSDSRRGHVKGKPLRFLHGHNVQSHGHGGNSQRGRRPTRTYRTWESMLARCYSPATNGYERYGGRGITVCDRWNPKAGGCFANFLADMGERPEGRTLDRIDGTGNYEPTNCRWATLQEQRANQKQKTHCRHGHEFTPENTLVVRSGERKCRTCKRQRDREFRLRRKEASK